MFVRATDHEERRGSALVAAMVVFAGLAGMMYVAVAFSSAGVRESRAAFDDVRARYLAEAGIERGLNFLDQAAAKTNVYDPMAGLSAMFAGGSTITPFVGEPMTSGPEQTGAYTVSMELLQSTPTKVVVDVVASGYLPDAPSNLPGGRRPASWSSTRATVEYRLEPSQVFDYGYFINNWGWFYGSTIQCNGNARSNGQFDAAGYKPTITGQPTYGSLDKSGGTLDLLNYIDDNLDGLLDGNDGGIFSGWDIVGVQNVKGNGGKASNQHDFQGSVEMPNLSDLSSYETQAKDQNSEIKVGGVTVSDAVFGDAPGETGNLYLVGTPTDPIVLEGPVVARGDVVISGYVTGQGAIYAGGNVYVPDSVVYVNPPDTPRPADNTEAATEAWLNANKDRDFLGLFAAENVVVGDYTNSTWRQYVGGWMASSLNKSAEDAGEDGIPNTSAGKDGIPGTADDDVLEDDGVFTTDIYTAQDQALGLIPPGKSVGDPIPGTGEDIDGDGVYDPTTTLSDLDMAASLTPSAWGGNMPSTGISKYSDIASLYASHLDAVFYTNHSFCYMVLGNSPARINGALVSRNENIVYGTPSIEFNYDARLLGGFDGLAGKLLPHTLGTPRILRWQTLDRDPNRYAQP